MRSSSQSHRTAAAQFRLSILLPILACGVLSGVTKAQISGAQHGPVSRLLAPIDENAVTSLRGNVRRDVAQAPDLGPVQDAMPMQLFLLLQRTPAQQADLENLIARQQQPNAPEYHKWLTPAQFGARFGASQEDIAKLTAWLESHGLQVHGVLNNASMINFSATAGQVREAFHTQLHYVSMRGGRFPALLQEPQIPAALSSVVAGIAGLNKIPARANHTPVGHASWDESTHRWHRDQPAATELASPAYTAGNGVTYDVTPQDLYTIYKLNPVFTGGNLAASATVAVVEQSDIEYGTVNGTTGAATGGDVATFRTRFGVPGTLNMHVYHGYGAVTCSAPGIDPNSNGEDVEASLDAEWANATAPSANLIFMSCDQSPDNGIWSSFAALIDNNLSDVMSLSYGESEQFFTASNYTFQDNLFSQAATQGQSILISSGDSGSDVRDQNTSGTAVSGINVSGFGSPMVTVTGGTDFSDYYDAAEGGPAESTYWGSTNSATYGDALSYVPEMPWNDSCASSLLAVYEGFSGAGLCATGNFVNGYVVGGSGGISTHYAVPSWQTGTSGYSNAMRAQPDIAGFASGGFWGHGLIFCDSNPAISSPPTCASSASFGVAGGTSFVAPYMAGVFGLLRTSTGARQGVLNPTLYALARAQYTAAATKTACYANGQTANTGVTTGLPASSCIFNDVTTGNNDVPCASGSQKCFVNSGQTYGMLSLNGSSSLSVAYPSTIGFDQVTGLGTINVNNLLSKWSSAVIPTKAAITSPVGGSTLTGSTVVFQWTTGTGVTQYSLHVGTTGAGSANIFGGTVTGQSKSVSNIPTTGGTLYVRLYSMISGAWQFNDYTYTEATSSPATITSPVGGSTLTGSSVVFSWTTGTGVTQYSLHVGTTGAGSTNIFGGTVTGTSKSISGIPTNGGTLYVRLYSMISGAWQFRDYTYTEASSTPAAITSPAPGSTLTGSTVVFSWTTGVNVTQYSLHVGTTGAGSANIFGGTVTGQSKSVSGIPTTGGTLYVRLYSMISGVWQFNDYTYTEQ